MSPPDIEALLVDFYGGAQALQVVSTWAQAVTNQRELLERLAAFERAYEQLAELQAAGKIEAGAADFSPENRARAALVARLIASGLDSAGAQQAAGEVHTLAERCLSGLKDAAAKAGHS